MKAHPSTIWESASRPLFVRSVWLEAAGRTLQRHFILDYQQKDFEKRYKSAIVRRERDNLKQSVSYELTGYYDHSTDQNEELLHISSAKLRLQQQTQQSFSKPLGKSNKNKRRHSYLNRKHYNSNPLQKRNSDAFWQNSRRSSLQDSQSTQTNSFVNPEERLAERVLHWLDLAGKTDILKQEKEGNNKTSEEIIVEMSTADGTKSKQTKVKRVGNGNQSTMHNSRSIQQPFSSIIGGTSSTQHQQRTTHPQRKINSSYNRKQNTAAPNANICQHGRPDSVKHITIIFDKDGVPVRLNRPARNIDLCALSSSANTTRRLAGTLASARLYNSAAEKHIGGVKSCNKSQLVKSPMRKTGANSSNTHGTTIKHTCLHEDTSCRTIGDVRKQLHIFMPSLPKKSLLGSTSVEDTNSALSNAFSELCNM